MQARSWRELNINITDYFPCVSHAPSNRMDCITIQYCTWHRLWSVMIKSVWLKPTPTNSFVVGTLQWRELVGAGFSQTLFEWNIWMFLEVISKDCNTCTCTNMFSLVWTSCAKPTFHYHQVQLQGILFCEWNTVQTGITADKQETGPTCCVYSEAKWLERGIRLVQISRGYAARTQREC